MEQSMVKLRIAEAEKLRAKQLESATHVRPTSGFKLDKDGKYYLVRLEMEIEKINRMIGNAERDSREHIPEEALGKIRNAVGKAQLLINKKFQQFNELCRDNIVGTSEADPDKKETKPSDLEGYWEMMYIQIEDVRRLFDEIERLRASNWQIHESVDGHIQVQSGSQPSVTPKAKRKSGGKSPRAKAKSSPSPAVDEEKVKREARSRMAAARKLAKERLELESGKSAPSALLDASDVSSGELDVSIHSQPLTPARDAEMSDGAETSYLEGSSTESSRLQQALSPAHGTICNGKSSLDEDEPDHADDADCCRDHHGDPCTSSKYAVVSDQPDIIVTTPPDIVITNQPPSPIQTL